MQPCVIRDALAYLNILKQEIKELKKAMVTDYSVAPGDAKVN